MHPKSTTLTASNVTVRFRFFAGDFQGGTALSRQGKTDRPADLLSVDQGRRDFLIRCCQGTSAAFVPASLRRLAFSPGYFDPQGVVSADGEFHLHPHYRAKLPLEAVLLKTEPSLDQFITEKYADQIVATLAEWSASLRKSPHDTRAVEKAISKDFAGASLKPLESQLSRSNAGLEVRRNQFANTATLGPDAFLNDLRSTLNAFAEIIVAEFQVTSIKAILSNRPASLQTRVRYDLVGSGHDFYREQRVGEWDLEWETSPVGDPGGELRVRSWRALGETQSRSLAPVFVDVAGQAFGANPSFSAQMLHGSDYWRTVLDQACGIDIYGHNGVAVGDIDGDGFDDIYVCQAAGLPNRLYRNRGDGTFEDVTEASGLGILENTACALFADFDNDGRQDLVVVRTDGPVLYRNEGAPKFRKQPDAFHFAKPPQGTFTGAAIADYDRDGYLDIYFCLYLYYQGADQYKYPLPYFDAENGPPNFLMKNNRDGTFRDVTAQSGLDQNNTRYSFCCGWSDYNRDGWPDLYVVNDFGRKNLYHNSGNGTFTDIAPQAGVEDVGAGMSVCWFDYDNDGAEDLYVANMWTAAGERVSMQEAFQKDAPENVRTLYRKHSMGNSLFRNGSGDGAFQNQSSAAGVEMGRWSWSSDAWDFDHDGFPDLYIANGMVSGPLHPDLNSFFWRQVVANSPAQARPSPDYEQGWNALNELIRADGTWSGYERNVFYVNNRDGTFSDVSGAVGMDFVEDGRSFALADFDHDGRLEVLLKNRNAPQLRLLRNVIKDLGPSIAFRLRGSKSNRDAIGAAVTVQTESSRQTRMLQAGSGFLAQHTKEVFFGLGDAQRPVRASIRWPSGLVQELRDLPLNHRIWVEEGVHPSRMEPFTQASAAHENPVLEQSEVETLPKVFGTWLLAPVTVPDFSLPDPAGQTRTLSVLRGKPVLLNFWAAGSADCREDLEAFQRHHGRWAAHGLQLLAVNVDDLPDSTGLREFIRQRQLSFPIVRATDDVAGIYNTLYRYLFDRHRDLELPTSVLINEKGEIVKIYRGPVNPEHVENDFRRIPETAAQRLAKGLPFPGVIDTSEFQRNYLSYGSVFFQREYFDQAEASFQLALRDDPSSAEALYGLGSVYLKQQKPTEARDSFERATKLQASYPETLPNAWNNLGLIATQDGRTEEALGYFQQALRLSPDHLIALDNLGNVYRQQKRWDEARSVLQRALVVHPQDPEANYSLGMVYAQTNETDQAYEYLQKALQFRPAYPEALNNLGVLYLRTGRRDQAVTRFEECIRVAPAFDQSYLNLARVHALEGELDKARNILQDLLKQHPDHAQAQKALAELGQ
jgi:tetratricopeptide (TPR) repeat protein/peroxiredoxin